MAWFVLVAAVIGAYLIGSINAAVIVSKSIMHKDVRDFGSGNAGMTNVMRVMGVGPGLLTFFIDAAKGAAICLLAKFLIFPYLFTSLGFEFLRPEYGAYYAGVLCVIGHIYPVFFGFRGGKGIATSLGALLVCQYQSALIAFALFLLLVAVTRIVSLGSVCAAFVLPFLNIVFAGGDGPYAKLIQCLLMAVLSGMVIFMHRTNIVRLIRGEEKKLTVKRSGEQK